MRVDGSRALAPGDVVQLGTFRLTYDGDSLYSFEQRGAIRLDATNLEGLIGDKVLLAPTTLSIEPCEFVAIVGGSGSGKSTLMTAMCAFARATRGSVTINGDDLYAGYDAYRSVIGYVPQDDILHLTLTVERALHHAARLRLPADTTPDEIEVRIAAVLDQVEMTEHATKRVDQLSALACAVVRTRSVSDPRGRRPRSLRTLKPSARRPVILGTSGPFVAQVETVPRRHQTSALR